ncbi:MAG: fibronectin type III domain-containing protein [Crocinitomicaceae bacterium]|nr:fibronectin type III domain-containing protein [Crocinitomicaceae bacterium]
MKIFLTLTDFTVPSYQVKLRFTLTGNGYSITTSSLLNLPTTTLSPGSPVEISGSDLAPYLSSQNLLFSGIDVADYEIRKVLPEGPCQICVEVIDFSNPNQAVLSNPACTQVWFSLNDPPLLNTPFCGTQITPTDPQQLIFSWTPLHMNSMHSSGTQYVFELFEIRPDGADPNQVVNSSLPIFMQVTDQTFINYGITEPQLQTGMSYVWRVRAQDIQGRDFFRNNGYSSVCTFTYGNIAESLADGITLTLNTAGTGTRKGDAWWNASSTFTSYKVEVRKTGNPDYEWFPYNATNGELKIYQLEPETQYECRVKGLIGTEYESEWSNISVFTTQPLTDYACGSTTTPPGEINFTPLTNAIAGLTFEIGQFELFVTDIEPLDPILQPGHYRGTGKIAVGFAIINIRVSFDDILVDDNLMVRSGKVEAITEGMDAWLAGTTEPDYYVDGTITDFEWVDSTSLTVWVDGVPQTFNFADHDPLVIQDEDGMIYTFHSDGTYTVISILVYSTDVLAGTADYRIDFSPDPNQIYGFDKKEYAAWLSDYEVIRLLDSTNYFVSYKSLAPDQTDYVIANIRSENPLSNVTFVAQTSTGTTNLASEQINDSTYRVTLAGMSSSFYVYAEDDGNRIGKLWVKVLPAIEKEIVFVPVNGASLSQIAQVETELNAIYKQANVSFDVTTKSNYQSSTWDLNADGKLQTGDVDLMSHYSEEMRLLRDEYFASDTGYNKNAYYIFIIPQFLQADLGGYMVRGKGVGFLKNGETPRTAAHELAHGIFALEHTFPAIEEGSTENLLDYSNGTHLAQKQWYDIHNPLPAFSFLDDEESGESVIVTGIIPDNMRNPDGSMTFISPSGFPVTIPANSKNIEFFTLDPLYKTGEYLTSGPIGTLLRFTLPYQTADTTYSFVKSGDGMYYKNITNRYYVDSLTYLHKPTKAIVGLPFYQGDFYVQLFYFDLNSSIQISLLLENYAANSGEIFTDYSKNIFGFIDRFSVIEVIFGISELPETEQNYIINELGETEWLFNPSSNNWQTFFNQTPGVILPCNIEPTPSALAMQYIQDNSQFAAKGNPLGIIIISNALWITEMESTGMLNYFDCYVGEDPLNDYIAISELIRSLNVQSSQNQDSQPLNYDFSISDQAFNFYERLQAELKVFEQALVGTENINAYIESRIDGNEDQQDELIDNLANLIGTNPCILNQISSLNRIHLFNMICDDDGYWMVDGKNLMLELFESADALQKISLAKNFKTLGWFYSIYDQLFETADVFDDEDFYAVEDLLDAITETYIANPDLFAVSGETKSLTYIGANESIYLNNVPDSELHSGMPVEFSVPKSYNIETLYREFPIFVGNKSNQFRIYNGDQFEESVYAVIQPDEIPFYFGDDGKFHVSGNYKLSSFQEDVTPAIENVYLEAIKPENVFLENYEDYNLDPFELVEVVFTSNYGSQGFDENTSILIPAYKLILVEKAVALHNSEYLTRVVIDAVEIGAVVLAAFTAPMTLGGSFSVFTGVIASLDPLVSANRYSSNSAQFNCGFYRGWDLLKSTIDLAAGIEAIPAIASGFVNIGKSIIKNTRALSVSLMMNRYIRKTKFIDDLPPSIEKTYVAQYSECIRQGKTWDEMAPLFYGSEGLSIGAAAITAKLNSNQNFLDAIVGLDHYQTTEAIIDRMSALHVLCPVKSVKGLDDVFADFDYFITNHFEGLPQSQFKEFMDEMLQTEHKFKAAGTSLEVIRYPGKYIPSKFNLQALELEDLISYSDEAGEFRFDLKWSAVDPDGNLVSILIDTKNYSTAGNMFSDLGQLKAYLASISDFDQFYIIQQGGRGVSQVSIVNRLKSAINSDFDNVFDVIWNNNNLRINLFGENMDMEAAYATFQNSVNDKTSEIFNSILITY